MIDDEDEDEPLMYWTSPGGDDVPLRYTPSADEFYALVGDDDIYICAKSLTALCKKLDKFKA